MTLLSRSRSSDQRSSSRNIAGTILSPFHSGAHRLHISVTAISFVQMPAMLRSALLTAFACACVCVGGMKANHYPTASQYSWAPTPAQQRTRPQPSAPGYNSAPGFWYGGSSKGDSWSYNRLPVSSYGAGGGGRYYKTERADAPATEGRVSGKAMAAGGYSRFTSNNQDPIHNRYGTFNIPPQNSQVYGNYGGYRNVGFYGAKGSAPNYAVPSYGAKSPPINYAVQPYGAKGPAPNYASPPYGSPPTVLQALRGSRIYEGPVGLKHNQTKKTGVYVIPTPAKLYYDGVKN